MDAIYDFMQGQTFWRGLLFLHFVMAVALLAAVSLQAVTVLMPERQAAVGNFEQRLNRRFDSPRQ